MRIVIFTSCFNRHKYFVKMLSDNFDKILYICENKPLIRSKITNKKKLYFKNVRNAEKRIFKDIKLKSSNIKKINFKYGDLNLEKLIKIDDFNNANIFLIFGSSFIKGKLFDYLKKKKALNIHMGVMPFYRGTDCNFWAVNDLQFKKIGASLMLLSKKIDNGKVLSIFHLKEIINKNLFFNSMLACKLSIDYFVNFLKKRKRIKFLKIDKSKLIRLSKKEDFNDFSISKFNSIQKKINLFKNK